MRLKSFHGPTLNDAMRQVRDTLGEDAIIVATRDDDLGGVRVTAAIDDAPTMPAPTINVPQDSTGSEDIIENIADALYRQGVNAGLAEKVLATATNFAEDDAVLALAAGFDAHLTFRPLADPPRYPIVLVGPPGAGKTLTIAKLATQAKLKKRAVTVITTDLARAGGVDQLAAFTRLLQVKLIEAEDAAAAADTLAALPKEQGLVLVDTAGRNPFDPTEQEELRTILKQTPCDVALVLPFGYDSQEGTELAQAFHELGATRLIATRLDLARRIGSLLNIAGESGVSFAHTASSPNVTQPLDIVNPITLARAVLQNPPTRTQQHVTQPGSGAVKKETA